ncbi:DUF3822 family protein [Dysgonomonas massiliensis]|uniref:DUF3822 family protein n=1 Tax=Dysgonomonas massiliensis TaxID=2040292 RepID=UPI000C792698|nr:DUF3822 family protein [Dysgonomonas massiliensis]
MFIPETIDLGKSENYNLVIRIKDDEFMFSIADAEHPDNRFVSGTEFSQDTLLSNIQRIIFDFNFLTQEFRSVSVIFVTPQYTIVPDKYFEEKERLDMYNAVSSVEAKSVLSCANKSQSSHTIFAVEKELCEFLKRSLCGPEFVHHISPLCELFSQQTSGKITSRRMYVNYHSGLMDVICVSDNSVEHSLTYKEQNIRTQLYFILKLWEQCGLDQSDDQLYIIGDRPAMVDDVLSTYIEKICHFDKFDTLFFPNLGGKQVPVDLLAL